MTISEEYSKHYMSFEYIIISFTKEHHTSHQFQTIQFPKNATGNMLGIVSWLNITKDGNRIPSALVRTNTVIFSFFIIVTDIIPELATLSVITHSRYECRKTCFHQS
jgi:hypothetical protein